MKNYELKNLNAVWKDEDERVFLSTPSSCSGNVTMETSKSANVYNITELYLTRTGNPIKVPQWVPRNWSSLGYLYQLNGLTLIGSFTSEDVIRSRIDSALEVSNSTKLGVIFEERSFVSETDALAVSKCDTYFGHETYYYSDASSSWS